MVPGFGGLMCFLCISAEMNEIDLAIYVQCLARLNWGNITYKRLVCMLQEEALTFLMKQRDIKNYKDVFEV